MKRLILSSALVLAASLASATAHADSIKGKIGLTGRVGFIAPSDNENDDGASRFLPNETDIGFVGGGGLIIGLDDTIAAEFEVTRSVFGSETGDFGMTDISLGGQYRIQPRAKMVPYIGAGLDILISDYDSHYVGPRDVDTTVGAHVSAGIDYFIQRRVALNAEARVLIAPDADITDKFGDHRGNFDPTNLTATVGIRYFFN